MNLIEAFKILTVRVYHLLIYGYSPTSKIYIISTIISPPKKTDNRNDFPQLCVRARNLCPSNPYYCIKSHSFGIANSKYLISKGIQLFGTLGIYYIINLCSLKLVWNDWQIRLQPRSAIIFITDHPVKGNHFADTVQVTNIEEPK